ncbi:MAG TPA: glutamate-1-semialdehyde 2,1-aminomutase [Candidatus Poseidoniales archaeon]|nr:aspartate aminotransferase family protein [Euryarchaeota archaeon]DAC23340.1 MAG TPA: glutamate-1-semialdehyde 2,1-aminomutase [Candidatus Poseidoniales archaeon]HII77564.1 glutamate-1-semialdehyde 2,1-aminomutase [Poseidonia sp.]|tara:strand:+ start:4685 stop:5974 length:1290 start_codon:yes stop_codon:yes gene_type:complete
MDRTKSDQLHTEALSHLVGGVNSPVRAFKSVHGNPIYFEKASGAHVTDVDGNVLVDFVQSWGPLIHGHSHPEIIEAVHEKMLNGTSFGAPHLGEIELAKRVKQRFPHMDKVRFVSSGTEAVMSAVRLARGYTGRDMLVKFEGCYHGHVDSLMVSSGSGLATFGIASSPGIPHDTVATTLICPLDDLEAVEYLFNEHGSEIAAVVIEPLPANNGLLVQRPEFLHGLRTLCDQHGALLIFDEVISGFRFQEGSYGDLCGVTPDLTALGKVIGGGLPVGAYGARSEIMEQLSPLGPVYQAGTLSGNPLAMAAGAKTLDLLSKEAYQHMDRLGALLEERLSAVFEKHGHPMRMVRRESLFWLSPGDGTPAVRADQIPKDAATLYADVHRALLDRGYMLAPSAYEIGFISTSHDESHILGMVEAMDDALSTLEW